MAKKFDLRMYPTRLQDGFRKGAMYWMVVIEAAKEIGYRHLDELTDLVFHMHHPELGGRSIVAGETALINEWNSFRYMIKTSIGYKPPKSDPPSTMKLLADADLKHMGGDIFAVEHASKLRAFLVRAMGGTKLDDAYWAYIYNDRYGRPHQCWEKDNVFALKRLSRKHALKQFEMKAADATSSAEIARALRAVEKDLFEHTNIVLRWAAENASNEAATKGIAEAGYLKELYRTVVARAPESVYCVYDRLILTTHHNYFNGTMSVF